MAKGAEIRADDAEENDEDIEPAKIAKDPKHPTVAATEEHSCTRPRTAAGVPPA